MIELITGTALQCQGCYEIFVSQGALEVHRAFIAPNFRRCLSAGEMMSVGMSKNAAGFWITAHMPASILASHDQNGHGKPLEGD